jgi:hypothetical protein
MLSVTSPDGSCAAAKLAVVAPPPAPSSPRPPSHTSPPSTASCPSPARPAPAPGRALPPATPLSAHAASGAKGQHEVLGKHGSASLGVNGSTAGGCDHNGWASGADEGCNKACATGTPRREEEEEAEVEGHGARGSANGLGGCAWRVEGVCKGLGGCVWKIDGDLGSGNGAGDSRGKEIRVLLQVLDCRLSRVAFGVRSSGFGIRLRAVEWVRVWFVSSRFLGHRCGVG